MGQEIERKYLVKNDDYKEETTDHLHIQQGYFADGVRVRMSKNDSGYQQGFITFKSPKEGMTRDEFEYEIPYVEAKEILDDMCKGPLIEKIRHHVYFEDNKWEVDEFFGDNEGLVITELEVPGEDYEYNKPNWVGKDVTDKKRYYNSDLTELPYKKWKKKWKN